MTNINCSSNCVYQVDGKCLFDKTSEILLTPNSKCAYFCAAYNNDNNISHT